MKNQIIIKKEKSFRMIRKYKYECKKCKEIKSIGYIHINVYQPNIYFFICKHCEENKKIKLPRRFEKLTLLKEEE
jgi:hypothetical protein